VYDSAEASPSEFKRIFKFYKRKDSPLDLSKLLDPQKPAFMGNMICENFSESEWPRLDDSCRELMTQIAGLRYFLY
jgi:hypothetical protein